MKDSYVKIHHKCLACGSELSEPLFKLPNMPAGAQSMPTEDELTSDHGIDLELCRCPHCGLVQFDCEPVEYYRDAIRVVGLSDTMKALRREDYRYVIGRYGKAGRKWLECGCGNGDFLTVLTEFDADIYGTEHGEREYDEAVRKLCGECGIAMSHIMKIFPESADTDIPGAPFDVFTSFNFLEHQPDPSAMLGCIYRNLAEDGIGIITVPSFEYIIEKGRYYELVRDHIANYDMYALINLCRQNGFEVLEQTRIGIGDTLRVIVRKLPDGGNIAETSQHTHLSESGSSKSSAADGVIHIQTSYDNGLYADGRQSDNADSLPPMNISALKEDYERMSGEIAGYMSDLARKGRSAALWGAGHQGFTIASTTAFGEHIKYIIDSSPKKQGRYAPASHLRIVSPDEYLKDPVDVIIVAAPGYVNEIERDIRQRYADTHVGVPAVCSILDLAEH